MTSMGIWAPLVIVLLLYLATVTAARKDGGVQFWGKKFTMTCPEEGEWYDKDNKNVTDQTSDRNKFELEYGNDKKGRYYCKYGTSQKYYFFVQAKVCENCFELDAALFGLVIVMDMALTAVVMIIIFMCTKKKNPAGPAHPPKTPARPGGRGPPVPSPDYEQLNAHTRSQDTYSIVNRTG